jgi:exodeoxyribonuclease VII small subunit
LIHSMNEQDEQVKNDAFQSVMASDETIKDLSYEQALAVLEQVVSRLESGEATLDESMELFRKGTLLSKACSARLEAIEKQITQLIEKADGTIEEKPFGDES